MRTFVITLSIVAALAGPAALEVRAGGIGAGRTIARQAMNSALSDAGAEYYLALAKANNLANAADRRAASAVALWTLQESMEEAEEQYQARLGVYRELGEARYNPVVNASNFLTPAETAASPNPYMPLVPGKTHVYRSVTAEGTEIVTVEVTHETRVILGVACMVIHDTAKLNGIVIEDTRDWYAQDRQGNVWYFGEDTQEYENGKVSSIDGSWEAGEDGALPGIIMQANPVVGQVYRQEFALGEAEDMARVLSLGASESVPYGAFNNCLQTQDFTPMDPGNVEHKYFAPGAGEILAVNVETGAREELIDIQTE